MLLLLLLILLILFGGGYWGYGRGYGWGSWSPLTLGIVILLVLVFTGTVHADPQGTWWIDPDTGTYSMIDPQSRALVSGCASVEVPDAIDG